MLIWKLSVNLASVGSELLLYVHQNFNLKLNIRIAIIKILKIVRKHSRKVFVGALENA
jgi:hypothetical protein